MTSEEFRDAAEALDEAALKLEGWLQVYLPPDERRMVEEVKSVVDSVHALMLLESNAARRRETARA